ncbi:MAG TPA: M23 family metallopeptidase [Polyangiales bacterium]|jgi:murein DD-endopeptidase MepM/ murein hydrolase activator NlpD|nr:M23 family metallopeptidase [Polyangiales bacterium]
MAMKLAPRVQVASSGFLVGSLAALSISLSPVARVAAEPSTPVALTTGTLQEATESIARIKLDASGKPAFLARFSNGPRNVPVARGNARARAERLGLSSHREEMRPLLWTRPDPALLAEVRGEMPKNLLWPVVGGTFGRGFGYTRTLRPELPHNGIDIGAKAGAIVRAAADGLVVYSDNTLPGYGNCVMILHANGWLTLYAHNARTTVQAGWRVKRGERIALVGQTGYAWGPHLHFELRDNGKLRDPEPLITGWKSSELNGPMVDLDGPMPDAHAPEAHAPEAHAPEAAAPTTVVAATTAAVGGTSKGEAAEPAPTPAPELAALADPEPERAAVSEAVQAQRLLQRPATHGEMERAGGRTFRTLLWPVKGGEARRNPARFEIGASAGSEVRAAADGIVVYNGRELPGYSGNVVVVLHGNGWVTLYAGTDRASVRAGDRVQRGQRIAHVGTPEGANEPCLRFEWRVDGKAKDPRALQQALVGAP